MKRRAFVLGLILAAPAAPLAAAVVGNGTPGSCTEAALNTAVAAIVPTGGVITFNCGGPATINLTAEKVFYRPTAPTLVYTIDGGGIITLNGQGITRHFFHLSGTLNISNMTLTGGRAVGVAENADGGSIRSDRNPAQVPTPVSLNLNNVTFTNNATNLTGFSAPFSPFDYGGGAVFSRLAFLSVANCRFTNNVATNSAGGAIQGRSSTISIDGSLLAVNQSTGGGFGGAMYVDGASPSGANGTIQITNSTFSDNTALQQGGALFFFLHAGEAESVTLDTVNVINNRVVDSGNIPFVGSRGWGGGVGGNNGNWIIRNSTFAGNTVRGQIAVNGGGFGGGLSVTQGELVTITNSTFSNNQAFGSSTDSGGGGILILANTQQFQIVHSTITQNQSAQATPGILSQANGTLVNTIVSSNTSPSGQQCAAQLSNGGGALQFPSSAPLCANAIIVANPLLGALANNGGFTSTHHPQAGSPAVNAVSCASARDQRGFARPQGPACDIGSVEVACTAVSLNPLTLPTGRVGTPYAQVFSASGGTAPFTFSLSGTLPTGLTFNPGTGTLSGTPTQSGNFVITIGVSDGLNCGGTRIYNLAIASTVAIAPIALTVDPAGNGVFEANEQVVMDPTWLNQTGSPVALGGALASFIGPPANYNIVDGNATYPTIANGATGRCSTTGNCYSVSIGAASRPAVHWDASVTELLNTGGPKAWTLHIGGSFADVAVGSPFYRFIEILLHRGISGGCATGTYCPGTGTTRDQMAVFVLVAKQGAGYLPPACGTPMFPDVPASNPFCRWIEELARRGVVSGCGGGNYCPTTPVTRDQMAVFVLRTLDPVLNPPACATPMFADVPASNAFCRWIEELARRGVVSGCGGGNYCPGSAVTRDQMGVFLSATFGLTLYGP